MDFRPPVEDTGWYTPDPDETVDWTGTFAPIIMYGIIAAGVIVGLYGVLFPVIAGASYFSLTIWLTPVGIMIVVWGYLRHQLTYYVITNKAVYHRSGILGRDIPSISHANIKYARFNQSYLGELFNYGDVVIYTAGTARADLVFTGCPNPEAVVQNLRKHSNSPLSPEATNTDTTDTSADVV